MHNHVTFIYSAGFLILINTRLSYLSFLIILVIILILIELFLENHDCGKIKCPNKLAAMFPNSTLCIEKNR